MASGVFSMLILTHLTGPRCLISFSTPDLPIYGWPVQIVLVALPVFPLSTPQHQRHSEKQRQLCRMDQ